MRAMASSGRSTCSLTFSEKAKSNPLIGGKILCLAGHDGGFYRGQFQHDIAELSEFAKTLAYRPNGRDSKPLRRQLATEQEHAPADFQQCRIYREPCQI